MNALRVGWKVLALSTFTPTLVASLILGRFLLGGSSRPGAAWESAALRTWARVSARILGVRIRVRGVRGSWSTHPHPAGGRCPRGPGDTVKNM